MVSSPVRPAGSVPVGQRLQPLLIFFLRWVSGIPAANSPLFGIDGISRGQGGRGGVDGPPGHANWLLGRAGAAGKGHRQRSGDCGARLPQFGSYAGDSSFGGDYVRRAGRVECRPLPDSYRSLSVGNLRSPGGRDDFRQPQPARGQRHQVFSVATGPSSPAAYRLRLRRLCEVSPPSWMWRNRLPGGSATTGPNW